MGTGIKCKKWISNDGDRDKKSGIKNRGIKKENKKQKTVPIKNIKTDTFNVYRYFIY